MFLHAIFISDKYYLQDGKSDTPEMTQFMRNLTQFIEVYAYGVKISSQPHWQTVKGPVF